MLNLTATQPVQYTTKTCPICTEVRNQAYDQISASMCMIGVVTGTIPDLLTRPLDDFSPPNPLYPTIGGFLGLAIGQGFKMLCERCIAPLNEQVCNMHNRLNHDS